MALFLLALVLSGVVAAAGTFHGATNLNRTRQIGTAVANNAVEQARALSFNDLKLDPSSIPTPNPFASGYADPDCTTAGGAPSNGTCTQASGTIVTGAVNCSSCIPYTYTTSQRGITYTVTQVVLKLASYVDNQNQTQTLKKLIVKVAWTQPKAGSTTIATVLNNQDYLNPPTPTGVNVEIHDDGCVDDPANPGTPLAGTCGTSPGAILGADGLYWTVTIKDVNGNNVTGSPFQTTEGALINTTLAPGTYYCTVTNAGLGDTLGYFKMGSDNAPISSFGCNGATLAANSPGEAFTVVQGDTTNLISQWSYSNTCKVSSTNGQIQLTVTDNSDEPQPLANANIVLINSNGTKTFTFHTDADGTVLSPNMPADTYSYTVTLATYSGSLGSICVYANADVPLKVQLAKAPGNAGTLTVKVTNNTKTNNTYTINADGASTGLLTQSLAVGAGKNQTATFSGIPTDNYTVSVCLPPTCDSVPPASQQANILTNGQTVALNWTDS